MTYKPARNHPWKRSTRTKATPEENAGYADFSRLEEPAQPLHTLYMRGWERAMADQEAISRGLVERFDGQQENQQQNQ